MAPLTRELVPGELTLLMLMFAVRPAGLANAPLVGPGLLTGKIAPGPAFSPSK